MEIQDTAVNNLEADNFEKYILSSSIRTTKNTALQMIRSLNN